MKKYYPVDFDTKGNAILGEARSTPTSNSFIPTTWTPGGGSEDDGNGIKSITISPSITTTPALESLFPIEWKNGTESYTYGLKTASAPDGTYTVTVTPSADMCLYGDDGYLPAGEPYVCEVTAADGYLYFGASAKQEDGETDCLTLSFSASTDEPSPGYVTGNEGIESITISPSVETAIPMTDIFPIYSKGGAVTVDYDLGGTPAPEDTYTITVTPTANASLMDYNSGDTTQAGEPLVITGTYTEVIDLSLAAYLPNNATIEATLHFGAWGE